MLSARLGLSFGVALILAHLYLMFASLQGAKADLEVTDKMRKLATIVIQNFPDRKSLSDESFWKIIGRAGNPMQDSWGSSFQLEMRGRDFYWRSSGPDRISGSRDDLIVKVPFVDGPPPDLGPPEGYTGFPGTDAK